MGSFSFKQFIEQEMGKFPQFVIYAVLEWILIIILFLDGILSFLSNEFANLFELKTPCLLCTRIDHVLVRRNPEFYYNDSVCDSHKKDLSFLAYCHLHRKLSDIRSMCEQCLVSFATEKESNCGNYKSLVGILHKDLDSLVGDDLRLNLSLQVGKNDEYVQVERSSTQHCSCCGELLKIKSFFPKRRNRTPATSLGITSQNIGLTPQTAAPTPTPRAYFANPKIEELRASELVKLEAEIGEDEDSKAANTPLLSDSEYLNEEACRTPNFPRANKFFGIPLTDSPSSSPRWITKFSNNSMNETEGDNTILHRLKRQVRLDRKSLIALYMELDEERSASAVAANNAMAMITKLQAEKAAVQMEALQYQRMMEEQAEYDQQALQVMKDTLGKKEDEIKEFEAELEIYRQKSGPEVTTESTWRQGDTLNDVENLKDEENFDSNGDIEEVNQPGSLEEPWLDIEKEKFHILDRLKGLEEKIKSSAYGIVQSFQPTSEALSSEQDDDTGDSSDNTLMNEIFHIGARLHALDADSGVLKRVGIALQKGSEGTKLLAELARHM